MAVNRRILTWGPALLMVLLSLLLYSGARDHSRLSAEEELIWGNEAVAHGKIGLILLGQWQAGDYRPQVRPVATIVRAIEHAAYDFRRERYQWDQILLHGIAGALLFLLLWRWMGSLPAAALGGLLFVAHPGASQSVLYLGGLAEILSTVFFLGCLVALPNPAGSGRLAGPFRLDGGRSGSRRWPHARCSARRRDSCFPSWPASCCLIPASIGQFGRRSIWRLA